jgi:undecaprenyl diphosphate synthase
VLLWPHWRGALVRPLNFLPTSSLQIPTSHSPSSQRPIGLQIPLHIAIIPDGSNRWAKKNGVSLTNGYQAALVALENIVKRTQELGIRYLTLYVLSLENILHRSFQWHQDFTKLASIQVSSLLTNGSFSTVKFRIIGDTSQIREPLRTQLQELCESTKKNEGMLISLAVAYTGRHEILRTVNKILKKKIEEKSSSSSFTFITEEEFESYLDTGDLPPPDLILRSSGEMRISGFLLWQSAYSELIFLPELWPDVTVEKFDEALAEYGRRTRNFGRERA